MNLKDRKVLTSILVILVAAAAIGGGILAWFTDQSDPIDNEFTAGTVSISAGQSVIPEAFDFENWNPGDEVELEYTITNNGTIGTHLCADVAGGWENTELDDAVVTIEQDDNWQEVEGKLYYAGVLEPQGEVTLKLTVTLSPDTGNEYQGEKYSLSTTFDAIQESHNASEAAWNMKFEAGQWDVVPAP